MTELDQLEELKSKIFTIRGMQVMLDKDLAKFYEVKPIRLREQVKRNLSRFPVDFMFQLDDIETNWLVSHFAIASKKQLGGSLPYAFTEQGVAAVSAILTGEKAVEVSIQIMRAFVAMRRLLIVNSQLFQRIENMEQHQYLAEQKIEALFDAIEHKTITPKQGIFFDGQVFDAWNFVSDLVRSAEKSICLVDNYIDDRVLSLFLKRKDSVSLRIFTRNLPKDMIDDIDKFNEQYPGLKIIKFSKSHDRFLIIDDKQVYHIGASLKDLGKKWFAFTRMEKETGNVLMKEIMEKIKP